MENKYFVPDIEDLHIGVVYEYYDQGLQFDEHGRFIPDEIRDDEFMWRGGIIKYPSDLLHLSIRLDKNTLRIPYLTKEQVEAEGWVFHKQGNIGGIFYLLFKNSFRVAIWIDSLEIEFEESEGNTLFYGECKDINTFRKICKLLNIK